jgi:HEAT repeat protein
MKKYWFLLGIFLLTSILQAQTTDLVLQYLEDIKSEDSYTRIRAIDALGNLRDVRAIEPLINAMADELHYAAEDAAKAMAKYGKTGTPHLIRALSNPNPQIRVWAVGAIDMSGDKQAVPALTEALKKEKAANVRIGLMYALGNLKDPLPIPVLIKILKEKDGMIRMSAAYALGYIKDPRAVEPLIKALEDQRPAVRNYVTWALYNITNQSFEQDIPAWKKWWKDNQKNYRK